jgi:hypothetical protein
MDPKRTDTATGIVERTQRSVSMRTAIVLLATICFSGASYAQYSPYCWPGYPCPSPPQQQGQQPQQRSQQPQQQSQQQPVKPKPKPRPKPKPKPKPSQDAWREHLIGEVRAFCHRYPHDNACLRAEPALRPEPALHPEPPPEPALQPDQPPEQPDH